MRAWATLAAGAVVYALVGVWAAPHLPADGVALHFTASGQADVVGTRHTAVATWAWVGFGMLALGATTVLVAQCGSLRLLDVPHRSYWTADRQRVRIVRRLLATDIATIIGCTLVFLALIPLWTVLSARTADGAVAAPVFWVPVGLYLVGLVTWIRLSRNRYRPRPE